MTKQFRQPSQSPKNDMVVTSPMELDENEKDKLVKRFAERILQLGLATYDWKEKN